MDSFIDPDSRTWNSLVIRAIQVLVDLQDMKIIESNPLSRIQMVDREGWNFTKKGKYTAQSRYQVEHVYPNKKKLLVVFGPTVDILKAFCWKVQCPPKIKHFYGNWCRDV